jgi:tRNA-specific 2-thiouridylase
MDGMRVVDIDASKNHIIVGESSSLYKHKLYITNYNIVNISELLSADDITVKIRGIGVNPQRPVHITQRGEELIAETPDAAFAPAKGQPLVFYRNNLVIGGGIVVDFE